MRISRRAELALSLVVMAACHYAAPVASRPLASMPRPWAVTKGTVPNAIVGQVVGDSGLALSDVAVVLDGKRREITDASGRFQFLDVSAGRHALRGLRIGYHPAQDSVSIVEGSGLAVVFQLRIAPVQLGEVCTLPVLPSVVVNVYPVRVPGAPTAAAMRIPAGAAIHITDGDYDETFVVDSASVNNGVAVVQGPAERPGSYSVEVTAPGFRRLRRAGIRVVRQGCSVTPHVVDVRMEPPNLE